MSERGEKFASEGDVVMVFNDHQDVMDIYTKEGETWTVDEKYVKRHYERPASLESFADRILYARLLLIPISAGFGMEELEHPLVDDLEAAIKHLDEIPLELVDDVDYLESFRK